MIHTIKGFSVVNWRRQWHPTPVLLPGKFHGWRSLVGYSPWGRKEEDVTEWLHFLSFYSSFWRRQWQTAPVFLPGESHGQRGLVGYSLWGCRESDTTKQLTHTHKPFKRPHCQPKVSQNYLIILPKNDLELPKNVTFISLPLPSCSLRAYGGTGR